MSTNRAGTVSGEEIKKLTCAFGEQYVPDLIRLGIHPPKKPYTPIEVDGVVLLVHPDIDPTTLDASVLTMADDDGGFENLFHVRDNVYLVLGDMQQRRELTFSEAASQSVTIAGIRFANALRSGYRNDWKRGGHVYEHADSRIGDE